MATVNWKYWLIAVTVGPVAAILVMLGLFGLGSATFSRLALIAGPVLFGGVFAWCLRGTVGLGWRRGGIVVAGLGAAHVLAFVACVRSDEIYERWSIGSYDVSGLAVLFTYGGTFALAVTGLLAWLFSAVRSLGLAVAAILAAGLASLVYLPLEKIFPGFIISDEAAAISFGIVYAVVAGIFGWRLFTPGAARAG